MNKILRFSMMAVLALVANIGFAQTTTLWQEDFSSYKDKEVPKGGTYNYACDVEGTMVYAENRAGGDAPELLVKKKKGSFSATVALNGVSGQLTLTYKTNQNIKITVENAKAGDVVKVGNDCTCPVTVAAGTNSITIKFSNTYSSNARLDNIKLFQGVGKKPAGLSWGTSARTVTIGAEDNKFPTLTNTYNLAVKYSSDAPDVAAIDAATGEITLGIPGKANIKAEFEGNDEYEAAKVSYELTVKAASTVDLKNTPETAYTVAKALELINAGEGLEANVYVKGQITNIQEVDITDKFGNATYTISDDATAANALLIYRGYYYDKGKFTSKDQIKVGDVVVVYGKLVKFYEKFEMNSGNHIYSINGVVSGVDNITVDKNVDAPAYNVAGQRVNDAYKGIVVKNGKKYLNK